jgi:hypothetical protein
MDSFRLSERTGAAVDLFMEENWAPFTDQKKRRSYWLRLCRLL